MEQTRILAHISISHNHHKGTPVHPATANMVPWAYTELQSKENQGGMHACIVTTHQNKTT